MLKTDSRDNTPVSTTGWKRCHQHFRCCLYFCTHEEKSDAFQNVKILPKAVEGLNNFMKWVHELEKKTFCSRAVGNITMGCAAPLNLTEIKCIRLNVYLTLPNKDKLKCSVVSPGEQLWVIAACVG